MIRIYNYELLNFNNEKIIISEKGISKINSSSLWNTLLDLQSIVENDIQDEHLDQLIEKHDLPIDETKSFLQSIVRFNVRTVENYYDEVFIIHDMNDVGQMKKTIGDEFERKPTFIHFNEFAIDKVKQERNFIHFHCENYNYSNLKSTYFRLAGALPMSAFSVSHFTNNSFNFSQPYLPEISNPCHFCEVDRACHYEEVNAGSNNWIKLLQFGKERKISVRVKNPSALHKALALGLLSQRIKLYTNNRGGSRYQDSIFSAAKINLNDGRITEENIPHWYLCRCLRDTP